MLFVYSFVSRLLRNTERAGAHAKAAGLMCIYPEQWPSGLLQFMFAFRAILPMVKLRYTSKTVSVLSPSPKISPQRNIRYVVVI